MGHYLAVHVFCASLRVLPSLHHALVLPEIVLQEIELELLVF